MFVAEAALIALREGLEALLITGLLLGLVTKLGRPDTRRHVWLGFFAAVATCLLAGYAIQAWLTTFFEEQGGADWFELVAATTAIVVLTYMVFWMWQHTRHLTRAVRGRVQAALAGSSVGTIVFLTYASVIREGLEVVLFYTALLADATPWDVAWSGAVGFAASALIVVLILRGVWKVDLQKFFAVTGVLLVFIAAGLIVHTTMTLTALGILPSAPPIWDTSAFASKESALGRVLHAVFGYHPAPTLLQAVLYFGYLFGVGGAYLWGVGVFRRVTPEGGRVVARRRVAGGVAAAALAALVVTAGAVTPPDVAPREDLAALSVEDLPEDLRFGVLLRSHGEPVHYNETTYQSFADFVENLLVMLGYEELLAVDHGTVLLDKAHPFEKGARLDADLMDAWTRDFDGPALYVGSPFPQVKETEVPLYDGLYQAPGGPGLGEPDILEAAGLSAYKTWLQMDNESPMHAGKGVILAHAEALLEAKYGDRVVVRTSYHVRPYVSDHETDLDAARAFVEAGVDVVVDVYTSTLQSDVMNHCMMRPHTLMAFHDAGFHGTIVHAAPVGFTDAYADAVVEKVRAELALLPADAVPAVLLTHHGGNPTSPNPCGSGTDQYHDQTRQLYERVEARLAEAGLLDGVHLYWVYGQGGGDASRSLYAPMDAVKAARDAGASHVVDVPYEMSADGMDNLVAHRGSYGLDQETAPNYDANGETRLTVHGLPVKITSASFGADLKAAALVDVAEAALAAHLDTV